MKQLSFRCFNPGTATCKIDGKRSGKRRKSIEQCRLISEKMSAPCKLWAAHPIPGDGEFIKRDCRVETLRVFCSQEGEKRGKGKKGMVENRDEGDRREGTTRTRNARPQTMEFYLVKNFPACRCSVILSNYTADPLPCIPRPIHGSRCSRHIS